VWHWRRLGEGKLGWQVASIARWQSHLEACQMANPTAAQAKDRIPSSGRRPIQSSPPALPELTKREDEIIELLAEGKRDREIARTIGVSLRTVQNHVSHILHKLNVKTRTAAARVQFERKAALRTKG
jgi:DNA-binding NarL/FixJ family response regulator